MTGLLLVAAAMFFKEINASIGKHEVDIHKESIYTFGFLSIFWGLVILIVIGFVRANFVFDPQSIPTLSIRLILEIVQVHVSLLAIVVAARSTFTFFRVWTIPILLVIDITLGYAIGIPQFIGIGLIVASFIILFLNHGIEKKGRALVLFTAINGAITISLFKYNITNFNSVEAEQSIAMLVVLFYLAFMATFVAKEDPIRFLAKPIFLLQSASSGISSILMSFAYLFAPTSIITAGKRSFSILWAILSGNVYFHEKKIIIKIISLVLIVAGLVALVL